MSRILRPFALLFPLGAPFLCVRPAGAQEPKLSAGNAPASTIAASTFALAQRDAARVNRSSKFKPSAITIPDVNAPTSTPIEVAPVAPAATPAPPKATTPATVPTAGTPTATARPLTIAAPAPPLMTEATPNIGPVVAPAKTPSATNRSVQKAVQRASLTATAPQIDAPKIAAPADDANTSKAALTKAPLTGTLPFRLPGDNPSATDPIDTGPNSVSSAPMVNPAAAPKALASREAIAQRLLLARMDADLARAQRRLDRAQTRLTEGQRQLGSVTNILRAAMLEMGDDSKGLHPFVRVAQRYLGTPYVWGGESARGFDCSGFIMRVMRDLGYRALPHSAAEQFRYGMPVARELLKPGDIVFFANTYKPGISHVGIYLGRGRFIHAANSKVGTIVSGINEPKWVEHYAGARRLIPAKS